MQHRKPSKIDLDKSSPPLQASPFDALAGVDGLVLAEPPPESAAIVPKVAPAPATKPGQRLILRREKKDRGGKTVVVISGYQGNPQVLDDLACKLRKQLGCGGTVESGEIVIQGDQPAAVAALLRKLNYRVAGVGSEETA